MIGRHSQAAFQRWNSGSAAIRETELLNKEIVWEFHHHDIYLTSIISTSRKKNVALFKGVIVVGERKR